ncbi:Sodium- and chloride-dependent betaine transporter-like [Oopsacas minuta]|uniref:Sodium- and chloride-dependent betaine transporter-like n=1 Tax=Oopsacas minuta TaxID=111878 RepID=A0AAV7K9M7_9METZ|nr:Sodium- and chloride-dependent betaine transporter-like [Oopsacas minuta]
MEKVPPAGEETDTKLSSKDLYPELGSDSTGDEDVNVSVKTDANKITPRAKKDRWSNRVEFQLSLIGLAVGFGNLWRFSYLCQKNGGGTFLFPYLVMLLTLGIPIYYLELLVGKVVQSGPLHALYRLVPSLGGIGLSMIVLIIYTSFYYMLILAYVLYYLFASFQNPPAWGSTFCGVNDSISRQLLPIASQTCLNESSRFFYYLTVLQASPSIEDIGSFNWKLLLLLLTAWIVLYICSFAGIKSTGKVVYVTALLPYVVLTIMFFRAVTLPGAGNGLLELFTPRIESLYSPQVWLEAGGQIFFSLGLGFGGNILLASHLDQNASVFLDAIFVSIVNSLTSIYASIVVFSILGYQSFILGTSVSDIVGGPGLVFIAFASALLEMPLSPLWSVLFFIMMVSLGLDSMFAGVESLVQVAHSLPYLKKLHKSLITGLICILMFLVGCIFTFGNGPYLFQLVDQFSGSFSIFLVAFFELIAISWFYGVEKLITWRSIDYKPTGRQCFKSLRNNRRFRLFSLWLWRSLWIVICPIIMMVVFVGSCISQILSNIEYTRFSNLTEIKTPYPVWASFLGSLITLSTLLPIPIFFCYKFKWRTIPVIFMKIWPQKFSPTIHWRRSDGPLLDELESVSGVETDSN